MLLKNVFGRRKKRKRGEKVKVEKKKKNSFLNYEFRSVTNYGNTDQLMRFKKHFKDEIEQDKLGSPPTKVSNYIN